MTWAETETLKVKTGTDEREQTNQNTYKPKWCDKTD